MAPTSHTTDLIARPSRPPSVPAAVGALGPLRPSTRTPHRWPSKLAARCCELPTVRRACCSPRRTPPTSTRPMRTPFMPRSGLTPRCSRPTSAAPCALALRRRSPAQRGAAPLSSRPTPAPACRAAPTRATAVMRQQHCCSEPMVSSPNWSATRQRRPSSSTAGASPARRRVVSGRSASARASTSRWPNPR